MNVSGRFSARKSLVSASGAAEKAKLVLSQRHGQGNIIDDEEGTNRRDLPEDEFKDFLNTYEEEKWWVEKEKPKINKSGLPGRSETIKEEDENEGSGSEEEKKLDSELSSMSNDSKYASDKEEEDETVWPSLDEALAKDFDINEVSTLKQRFNDLQRQPRKKTDLYPYKLQLLTKRIKRCRKCQKKIVVPNINISQKEPLRVNLQMTHHIPKVTIYRIGKFEPEKSSNHIDLMLQFRNPNENVATIVFKPMTLEQLKD